MRYSSGWSPFLEKYISKEKIQKRATQMIPELRGKSYAQRLKDLDIDSLETRRLRGRLIEVFKILNKFDNVDYKKFFQYDNNNITRSNEQKLRNPRNHPSETNLAKNFFTNEVVGKWNGLPRELVNSTSIYLTNTYRMYPINILQSNLTTLLILTD